MNNHLISFENIQKIIDKNRYFFSQDNLESIKKRKIDRVWLYLIDKYNILLIIKNEGVFKISANQIKEVMEPRLAVKFDHYKNLPVLFQKNKLSILPDTRGTYIITTGNAYKKFSPSKEDLKRQPTILPIPYYIQSLNSTNIKSETIAINVAYASGIISDFIDDKKIIPTVSGRMSSNSFSFKISNDNQETLEFDVNNSQIEIDAAFEGLNSLSLIEAKMDLSQDFLVRQLYYPFRTWSEQVSKKIKPIFLIFSNGIFYLYEYTFTDKNTYNSLKLIKYKTYSLINQKITKEVIESIVQNIKLVNYNKSIPFIQADSFDRVINLCELLKGSVLSQEEISTKYDFTVRQADYYSNAGRYLGLIKKISTRSYTLSQQGNKIFSLPYYEKQLALINQVLQHEIFNKLINQYFETITFPSRNDIETTLLFSEVSQYYNLTTIKRRASSVESWLKWIIKIISTD